MKAARRCVVTGATGMIGGELVRVLAGHGWSVVAVVRAADDARAAARLVDRLAKSRTAAPTRGGSWRAVAGDPTLPDLGVGDRRDLGDPDVIVHCAGFTSFIDDEECRRVNVGAARRVVDLARSLPRRPRVVFVSTAAVCMSPPHSDLDEDQAHGGYANGYTRSKREAERVFVESGLDVVIVRPSIVLSLGIADRPMARSILWVVPAMAEIGAVDVDPDGALDIVPVRYVVDSIAELLDRPSLAGRCYYVSSGRRSAVTCATLREAIAGVCPEVERVRFTADDPLATNRTRRRLHARLRGAIDHYAPFLTADITYCSDRLAAELGPRMPTCPPATDYIAELMSQVDERESFVESLRP